MSWFPPARSGRCGVYLKRETHVTKEGEGLASGAQLLGVIHTVNHGAPALPGVKELICAA